MPHQTFRSTHRVSYAECTVGNHLYHSRFLDILERARGEFFRELGSPMVELQTQDVIFPVTSCAMRFRAMARYDDQLVVELWLDRLSRARLSCASRITTEAGLLLHEAVVDLACTTVEGSPRRLPEPLAARLAAYVSPTSTP